MPGLRRQIVSLASIGLVVALVGACTDTVYQDRPAFNPPPDSTSGFLGYYTASEKQTTCGNCHVGQQGDWIQTKHSDAWADLQASGASQAFCEGCHSVNSRGNQPFAAVGYDKVKDAAYQDVQCESCHGPGFNHVQNPTVVANRPIPSILVYPNVTTTSVVTAADTANVVNSGCGGCHTDDSACKAPQLPQGVAELAARAAQYDPGDPTGRRVHGLPRGQGHSGRLGSQHHL